ncbi:MAG TPA: type II toxin-antitoxin system Phd/YefM family antitoxin [Methylomirabilota bacterium]|nr:type II toxin-antitoxin system Phd/YefM family antitoxin [Methylomirabilota bacterium]
MARIIGVTELQRKFRAVFDEVVRRHIPYILTRGSRPEAVILPYDKYLKFVRADESGVLDRLDRALARMADLNAKFSDEEVEADLIQATKTVRERKRKRKS